MEVRSETDYAPHHIQKVCAIFTAMRRFAKALESAGHQVRYIKLDDQNNRGFEANINQLIEEFGAQRFQYQLPDEYRVDQLLKSFAESLEIETSVSDTEHFLTERDDLRDFFEGKKTYLMESFYRQMRKKYGLLMAGDEPEGGKWNYDTGNRKKLPRDIDIPEPLEFDTDVSDIVELLESEGVKTIGTVNPKKLGWATSRREAQKSIGIHRRAPFEPVWHLPGCHAYRRMECLSQPVELCHERKNAASARCVETLYR